jgi:hypothetical protein
MKIEFEKFKYNSTACQEYYGDKLTYVISTDASSPSAGSQTLYNSVDKDAVCSSANNTCSFVATGNGTNGNKVYIHVLHDGKPAESKSTKMPVRASLSLNRRWSHWGSSKFTRLEKSRFGELILSSGSRLREVFARSLSLCHCLLAYQNGFSITSEV